MNVVAFAPRPAEIRAIAQLRLGMAHLSPFGLSEQWLLRDGGDRHWDLIATALGQDRAVFRGADGRPAYAAFCATSLEFTPPAASLLGQQAEVHSALYALSATRLGSLHTWRCDATQVARLRMISTFVSHDESGLNRRIERNQPHGQVELAAAPESLVVLDLRARNIARALRNSRPDSAPVYRETPSAALDFNAVGLLYFPTFSRLVETATARGGRTAGPLSCRDVVYLANIELGEGLRLYGHGQDCLMRREDGRLVAFAHTERA